MKTTLDVGNHHLPPFHQPHPPFQLVKRPFQFRPLQARPFQARPFHVRPFQLRPFQLRPLHAPLPARIPGRPTIPRCPIIPGRPTIPRCPTIPARPTIPPCPPPPPRPWGPAVANGVTVTATRQPKESISFELFMLNKVSNHYVSPSPESCIFLRRNKNKSHRITTHIITAAVTTETVTILGGVTSRANAVSSQSQSLPNTADSANRCVILSILRNAVSFSSLRAT
jgi:hypothetical protein